jgi:hypothetical protein
MPADMTERNMGTGFRVVCVQEAAGVAAPDLFLGVAEKK